MKFVATQKLTRQSPRKVRLVANQVKSLELPEMLKQLAVIERRATLVLLKTINQAIANAKNNHGVAFEDLELAELLVNEGPTYKRFRAVSRGQAHKILKRTCNIRVVLQTKSTPAEAKTDVKSTIKQETATKKVDAVKKPTEKPAEKATSKKTVTKKATVAKTDAKKAKTTKTTKETKSKSK